VRNVASGSEGKDMNETGRPSETSGTFREHANAENLRKRFSKSLETLAIQGGRLLIGLSGGADSVALLRLMLSVTRERNLELVVGHFDHALRPDSAADALWVQDLCRHWNVVCLAERNSDNSDRASEEQARSLRYDFLRRIANAQGCRWVAVAHTRDDQAETVLHHILRGSGLRGLAGMPASRPLTGDLLLVRPLLEMTRRELRDYLSELGQPFREDPSNSSPNYTRNRLRLNLLPMLRDEINPQVDEALIRLAMQAAEAHATMESLARELLTGAVLQRDPDFIRLRRTGFKDRPPGLVQELFQLLWREQQWPRQEFGRRHAESLAQMAIQGLPARLSLPGDLESVVRGEVLEVRRRVLPFRSQGGE